MKTYEYQDRILAVMQPGMPEPEYRVAHARVGVYPRGAVKGELADLNGTLKNVNALAAEILDQLVGIDDAVWAVIRGLVSGENVVLRSKPGLAKSTLGRLVGEGVNGRFFRETLAPDTTRNSLYGSIDPLALQKGEWSRKWGGLAGDNVRVALLDEFGKASEQVRNMLLDAFEEHAVMEGGHTHALDMLVGIAAMNEYPDGFTASAAWDRLGLRVEMDYPSRAENWKKLLLAAGGRKPIRTKIDPEDILLLQGLIDYRSIQMNGQMLETMVGIITELKKMRNDVSPRRVAAWKRVVVAQAMLESGVEAPAEKRHLIVGQDMLWVEPENARKIADIVGGASDPQRAERIAASADLEKIEAEKGRAPDLQTLTRHIAATRRILKAMKAHTDDAEAQEIANRAQELVEALTEGATKFIGNGK